MMRKGLVQHPIDDEWTYGTNEPIQVKDAFHADRYLDGGIDLMDDARKKDCQESKLDHGSSPIESALVMLACH